MPEPISPVPTTPIVSTGLGATPSSPATLAAARSAKKTWRSALACVGIAQAQEGRPFVGQSFAQRALAGLRTSRTASPGAVCPRVLRQRFRGRRVERQRHRPTGRQARRCGAAGLPTSFARNGYRCLAIRLPSDATWSTMPSDSASAAADDAAGGDHLDRRRRPDQARQALRSAGAGHDAELDFGQAELGLRAPRCDGGRRARSRRPPPSAAPLIAATTGLPLASIRSMTSGKVGSAIGAPNSRMSAPPTKLRPAPVMTTPSISSALRRHGGSPRTGRRAWKPTPH